MKKRRFLIYESTDSVRRDHYLGHIKARSMQQAIDKFLDDLAETAVINYATDSIDDITQTSGFASIRINHQISYFIEIDYKYGDINSD